MTLEEFGAGGTPAAARAAARAADGDDDDLAEEDLPQAEVLRVQDMLHELDGVNVLAPLVRHSKLPFRHLTAQYETHITHTPMMLAAEFARNSTARQTDFSCSTEERGAFWMHERRAEGSRPPSDGGEDSAAAKGRRRRVKGAVIAQFAANDPKLLADAAELIHPFVDGIDLNCGCPQKWAYQEEIGCYLLRQPEKVRDLVRGIKDRLGWDYPISVKIRIDQDLKHTEQLVSTAIQAGASHLTIHGRTRHEPSTVPPSLPGIAFAASLAHAQGVPTIGNGDIWTAQDAVDMRRETGVNGVMAARGLLANPALFSGYDKTPREAVESFVKISDDYSLPFGLFHKHLAMMLESHFARPERIWFNGLGSNAAVVDYLEGRGLNFSRPALGAGK